MSWRFVLPRLELGTGKTGPGAGVQEKALSQLGLRTLPKARTQGEWCDAWVAEAEDLGLEWKLACERAKLVSVGGKNQQKPLSKTVFDHNQSLETGLTTTNAWTWRQG